MVYCHYMKILTVLLGSVSLLSLTVVGQNLAPNSSFEVGSQGPESWELKYGPGKWENFGCSGTRSVSVVGTGDCGAMWVTTSKLAFEPGEVYIMRYKGMVTSWGGGVTSDFEGVGSRNALLSEGWGSYAFAAVMPTNITSGRLRLGHCGVNGTVYFDDVEVRQCRPVYTRAGGHLLGRGETFQTNLYSFDMPLKDLRSNHARGLYQHTAAFRGNEWLGKWYWVLSGSDFVIYRHSVDGLSFTNARVKVNIIDNYGGEFVLDVSSNGTDWQELARVVPSLGVPVEADVPPSLIPGAEIYVRMRTTGSMNVEGYRFEGSVPVELPSATGNTWFFEKEILEDTVQISAMADTPTGHVFTVSILNTNASPRPFNVFTQTEGPEATRDTQTAFLVSPLSTREVDILIPGCGPGANTARVRIEDPVENRTVLDGFLALWVAPIHDDSYGFRLNGAEDCAVWWCDGTYKVGRERSVPVATNQAVSIAAARNEYEPFQLILRPQTGLSNVSIAMTDFISSDLAGARISSTNVEVCLVDYVSLTRPTDATCETGDFPDPIVPLNGSISLAAGVNQPFWFTVYVPKDIPAGVYTATASINLGSSSIDVPVSLRVFGFTLPDTTHTRSVYGWYFEPKWHALKDTTQQKTVVDLYMQNFARHRITPNNLHRQAPIIYFYALVDGEVVLIHDFSSFDATMTRYMEEYNFTTLTAIDTPWWGTTYTGYSDETWSYYTKVMQPIAEHLRQKGWMDKAFLYAFDEPQMTPQSIANVEDGTRHLEQAAPGVRRLVTTTIQPTLYGNVDIWVPHLHYLDAELAAQRRTQGEESWWYISTGPRSPWPNNFIDYPAIDHRIRIWLAQKYGATGDLYWQTAWWTATGSELRNPWTDPMSVTPSTGAPWGNGDGMLLYPPVRTVPTQPVVAGPINSLRFELVRESMEDGEYFWLVDQAIRSAELRIGPYDPKVLAARAARSAALALVPSRTTFTKSSQALYKARLGLGEAIELLNDGSPVIVTGPKNKAVETNSTLVLRVETLAWPLPNFQWRFNGAAVDGATNALLTLEHLGPMQTGAYDVIVSNSVGVVTSAVARVEGYWSTAPTIIEHPSGLVRNAGEKAFFSVTALSSYRTRYTWLFNGSPLAEDWATNSTLLLTNVTPSQAGLYSVVLSNVAGVVTSSPARLTVLSSPTDFVVFSPAASWRYHDLGEDLGTAWVQPSYDDSGWSNGFAQLGYGEGDESTIICSTPGSARKPITTYFRRTFQLPEDLTDTALVGRLLSDDAAIVYLNGVEVYRNNLPAGEIHYSTSALIPISDAASESEWHEISLPRNLCASGTNVLAIEIHQQTDEYPWAFYPAGYWSFDEPAPPWRDSIGNNHFSAIGTAMTSTVGKIGGAVSNNCSYTDYLATSNSTDLSFSTPFTVGGWFAYGAATSLPATCLEKPSEFRLYYTGTAVNRYRFEVNGAYVQDQSSGKIGEWRFVLGWYDGTNAYIQVNNGSVYSTPASAPSASSTPLLALKKFDKVGGIAADEVFVYQRVLTPHERATLYASGMHLEDLSFDFSLKGTSAQLPEFLSGPDSLVRRPGDNAAFSLTAASSAPVSYHWNFNGTPIAGATNSLLFLPKVTLADAGEYTVTASNLAGTVTSPAGSLVVMPQPVPEVGTAIGFNGGRFYFDLLGQSGMLVVVEASTNLENWTPIQTNVVLNGQTRFSDPESGAYPRRFYRSRFLSANSSDLVIKPVAREGLTVNGFALDVTGQPGQKIVLETSTDMKSWIPVQETTLSTGYYRFFDSEAFVQPHRFYRVRAP